MKTQTLMLITFILSMMAFNSCESDQEFSNEVVHFKLDSNDGFKIADDISFLIKDIESTTLSEDVEILNVQFDKSENGRNFATVNFRGKDNVVKNIIYLDSFSDPEGK